MRLHFIAIGGSIMHGLAIALKAAGHQVTGSDDQIFDPARSRLAAHGLLPETLGWDAGRIVPGLDGVILGMHAFADNPELARAKELGLPMYSFPEYIYHHARHQQRIVVTGSYGKTTVTAMVMHALQQAGRKFDYLVGAQVPGFSNAVRLSGDAPVMIIEGDEYLASKEDPRPKFLVYQPHSVVVTGISWDHINVFPSEAEYVRQFELLIRSLPKAADIVYCEPDKRLAALVKAHADPQSQYLHPYDAPSYRIRNGRYEVRLEGAKGAVSVIGQHNMLNLHAAWLVCKQLGMEAQAFLDAIAGFTGAGMRMETLLSREDLVLIRDYAHAPAKVEATVEAARERYAKHNLIACMELHTFSSLSREYLPMYKGTMRQADRRLVFVDPHAVAQKRMQPLTAGELRAAFGDPGLVCAFSQEEVLQFIRQSRTQRDVLLMMSSGSFSGLDFQALGQ